MTEKKKTIVVRCTIDVPVEIPDSEDYDAYFDIEENHCPGTGLVGSAIEALMERHHETNTCWACAVNGKCEIIPSLNEE